MTSYSIDMHFLNETRYKDTKLLNLVHFTSVIPKLKKKTKVKEEKLKNRIFRHMTSLS